MINSVSQATGTTSSASAATQSDSSSQIGLNGFLTMFTTQLQYQDPTNPLQSYQLAAQLAEFSSVEQLTDLNTNFKTAQTTLDSIYGNQSVGMLDKQVTGTGNTLQLADGKATQGSYELSQPADVTVKITNAQGNTVRTIAVGNEAAGTYDVNWDGLTDSGSSATDGNYQFTVEATDSSGNTVSTTSTITGKCFGVRSDNGTTSLLLDSADGPTLSLDSVTAVQDMGTTSS